MGVGLEHQRGRGVAELVRNPAHGFPRGEGEARIGVTCAVKLGMICSGVWRSRAIAFPLSLPIRALQLDGFEGARQAFICCVAPSEIVIAVSNQQSPGVLRCVPGHRTHRHRDAHQNHRGKDFRRGFDIVPPWDADAG